MPGPFRNKRKTNLPSAMVARVLLARWANLWLVLVLG